MRKVFKSADYPSNPKGILYGVWKEMQKETPDYAAACMGAMWAAYLIDKNYNKGESWLDLSRLGAGSNALLTELEKEFGADELAGDKDVASHHDQGVHEVSGVETR